MAKKKEGPLTKIERLKELCLDIIENPQFQERDIYGSSDPETFCNQAVDYVARNLECYFGFEGLLANEIVEKMDTDPLWIQVDGLDAHIRANKGCLVVAGKKAPSHGHVAVIYPAGKMVMSAKWRKNPDTEGGYVPQVANVGPKVLTKVMGVNFAFRFVPRYWVHIPERGK